MSTEGINDFLDKEQNINSALMQEKKLSALKEEVKGDSQKEQITEALFVKNRIFLFIHTSNSHPLHEKSFSQLKESRPDFVRDVIGDARLNFEDIKTDRIEKIKKASAQAGSITEEMYPLFFYAAYAQTMLNKIKELRQEMSITFRDDSFLKEANDRRISG